MSSIKYRPEIDGLRACAVIPVILFHMGLDSIPGGGGEILVQRVRDIAAPKKAGADRWLEIMELAHNEGMKTSVTMMYGIGETLAERIEHLQRVRDVQSRTGGFTAFITWSCG